MYRLAKWDITDICNLKCKHCYNSDKIYLMLLLIFL